MSKETERTKELVRDAYDLAQRSRVLRAQVRKLAKKAVVLRQASKKVRDDLDRNDRNHNPTSPSAWGQ